MSSYSPTSNLSDVQRKILFTLAMIAVYRLGAHVPVPGLDVTKLAELFRTGFFGFLDLFTGGALSRIAIFALGIMPYITASIIMSLLTIVIPTLEEWSKEGEAGQKKVNQWTRYLTLILATFQAVAMTAFLSGRGVLETPGILTQILIILTLITGTMLIMWIGELITQFGIGNGMSLLIFASIVSRLPIATAQSLEVATPGLIAVAIAILILMAAGIITMELGQRRIPVQYAKRMVGRKVYGGASTYIPLKINQAGVIPIIFASSIMLFPGMLSQFFPGSAAQQAADFIRPGSAVYLLLFGAMTIFFTYFYTAIVFNPVKQADQLRKYGGFIPGVRPGKPTAQYLDRVLTRLTLPGGIILALIAISPSILFELINVTYFQEFGGTSILILVGVALETMRQIEAQMMMRHYEGFIK